MNARPLPAEAALDALGHPLRRVLLRLVAAQEQSVGELVRRVQPVRPVSQPAVSQHLGVLREAGLLTVRTEGTRRIYGLDHEGLADVRAWLDELVDPLAPLAQPLDALATEVARGRRARRASQPERVSRGAGA
ncbi:ArsR/SmtB family transcription factor [Cellulomonas uda]|uniref:Transcriptional regulator n=1 Tax=Cellulomonas uda TaxID=1714 RepID=A0A4Y3KBN9_CELUD|nr:metalloregulator ArsR/SmtB family transcription factor [Cellulomonas uda]NII66784.1 DNA-binding transcriptional ArsR family regulator [Cellulomonas uda]GEA80425.1 transcriptional regulator [Cellulomonas uda]